MTDYVQYLDNHLVVRIQTIAMSIQVICFVMCPDVLMCLGHVLHIFPSSLVV